MVNETSRIERRSTHISLGFYGESRRGIGFRSSVTLAAVFDVAADIRGADAFDGAHHRDEPDAREMGKLDKQRRKNRR